MADAVAVVGSTAKKAGKRYSVRDLRAFRIGAAIYRELVAAVGADDAAAGHLHDALDLICRGCHTYRKRAKLELFKTAREQAASAITDLLLAGTTDDDRRTMLADRIEQELLPDLSGLIRTTERRAQRERLDPFDAFASVPA